MAEQDTISPEARWQTEPPVSNGVEPARENGRVIAIAAPPVAAPGRKRRIFETEIEAEEVNHHLRKVGARHLQAIGWTGTDELYRIEVIRVTGGGVRWRVVEDW